MFSGFGLKPPASDFEFYFYSRLKAVMHVPPRSKPLRLRHSGSPQRHRIGWACILCPSQVRVAQVFGERGHCDLSPLSAAQFSGCTTGAPSQVDDDRPEP